jgi:hypothetical protein
MYRPTPLAPLAMIYSLNSRVKVRCHNGLWKSLNPLSQTSEFLLEVIDPFEEVLFFLLSDRD